MTKPFRALVAVDDSERAEDVMRTGATLARALRGTLVLYRGVAIPPDFTPPGAKDEIDLSAYLLQKATTELTALRDLFPDVPCDLRVEPVIDPWKGILAAGEAAHVDIIVIGSHGYRGWDHLLGTTAGKVANHAHRNVLVVHEQDGSLH